MRTQHVLHIYTKLKTNENLFVERKRAYHPRAHIFLKHFINEQVESFPSRNGKIRTVAACLNCYISLIINWS